MNTVLVLNATYEPLNVVPVRRAIVLLLKEKAELLEAASERVRAYLIVTDFFPEATVRYSAATLPHVVINQRVHFSGAPDEAALLRHIGLALR